MFALGLFIATVFASYGDTPAHAILRDLYAPAGSRIVVVRVNVVGRYATVLSRGATIEAAPVDFPILLKRFTFGWQPLEYLDRPCFLEARAISKRDRHALLLGMPKPQAARACPADRVADTGPAVDVEAVRKEMHGALVPFVGVGDNFALGAWYGSGGGNTLFRKVGSQWRVLSSGGGVLGTWEMRSFGVPAKDWCALGVYDAECSPKHYSRQG